MQLSVFKLYLVYSQPTEARLHSFSYENTTVQHQYILLPLAVLKRCFDILAIVPSYIPVPVQQLHGVGRYRRQCHTRSFSARVVGRQVRREPEKPRTRPRRLGGSRYSCASIFGLYSESCVSHMLGCPRIGRFNCSRRGWVYGWYTQPAHRYGGTRGSVIMHHKERIKDYVFNPRLHHNPAGQLPLIADTRRNFRHATVASQN